MAHGMVPLPEREDVARHHACPESVLVCDGGRGVWSRATPRPKQDGLSALCLRHCPPVPAVPWTVRPPVPAVLAQAGQAGADRAG
jgi:hypothetical protein